MLVFDVELLGVTSPPKVPADVAAAPKNAKKTKSGDRLPRAREGKGKEHPRAESTVEVHYSGWTTDGKMFDSSVARGQPAVFPLGGVIPGWTEGVQLMVVGEKTRFWIPGNLAYDNSPATRRPARDAGFRHRAPVDQVAVHRRVTGATGAACPVSTGSGTGALARGRASRS